MTASEGPPGWVPVGVARTPFGQKLGVPRQPGLAPAARGSIHLFAPWGEGTVGLEGVSHLWVVFSFHLHQDHPPTPKVRPPRLGGEATLGVFATRSPYRPNGIGLSLVELLEVRRAPDGTAELDVGGIDLVDGTPVLDLKPYVPWAECRPEARLPWAEAPEPTLPVHLPPGLDPDLGRLLTEVLGQDPRPRHDRGDRTYGTRLAGHEVRFRVGPEGVSVLSVRPADGVGPGGSGRISDASVG